MRTAAARSGSGAPVGGGEGDSRAADGQVGQGPFADVAYLQCAVLGADALVDVPQQRTVGHVEPARVAGGVVQVDEQQGRTGPAAQQSRAAAIARGRCLGQRVGNPRADVDGLLARATRMPGGTPVRAGARWPRVFAPDYGVTVEDLLRDHTIRAADRARLVGAVARLRAGMLDHGTVWQGFAPRNMFLHHGTLGLIDFEQCADVADDPVTAAEFLAWHEVFFADCLSPQERRLVFADHPATPRPPAGTALAADAFEQALWNRTSVTWAQRHALLARSVRLESAHPRPGGGVVFGHELGHFWGDFTAVEVEVRLFAALDPVVDTSTLVGCLEVFEAAMEADIDSHLLAAAAGDPLPAAHRTAAVGEVLDTAGAPALAAARAEYRDWYRDRDTCPADLVDRVVFALRSRANGIGTDLIAEALVGATDRRAQHTRRLVDTVEAGMAFLHADDRGHRFLDHAEPEHLQKLLSEAVPVDGTGFDAVLADTVGRIVRFSIAQSHTGYLAFPDTGNASAALAGSVLTRFLNQNVIAVDRSAPAATFATVQVVEWLRALVGYPALPLAELRGVRDVAGLWTPGGHLSNHIAMLTALGHRFPQARAHGLRALDTRPAVVMAGPIAHYSHSDAAFHLGLGWDAVLTVPARPDYTTDPDAVDALLSDPPEGTTPFMVVGVAGNCRTTGTDDLTALAEVCDRHGVWLHADACHGGALIFNQRLREQRLAGIDRAHSVSLDPHKGLFTPYPSSYIVFRDRGVLTQFSRHSATVMADGCWDLGLITPFLGSCGFEALPTWMLLKHLGARALGNLVEAREALVRHLERRLDDTGLFVRLNDVDFYRLAFVFCPPPVRAALRATDPTGRDRAVAVISRFTAEINDRLYRAGEVCFDEHTLADLDNRVGLGTTAKYTIMATCPGNPLTTRTDLDRALDHLVSTAQPLVTAMTTALDHDRHTEPMPLSGPAGWNDR